MRHSALRCALRSIVVAGAFVVGGTFVTAAPVAAQKRSESDAVNTAPPLSTLEQEAAIQTTGSVVVPPPTNTIPAFDTGITAHVAVLGEIDTNARRIALDPLEEDKPDITADALMRGQGSLSFLALRPGRQLRLQLDAGGKMFSQLASERMAVAQVLSGIDVAVTPQISITARHFSKVRVQTSLARTYTIHRADLGTDIYLNRDWSVRAAAYGSGFHGWNTPQFSSVSSGGSAGLSWRISGQERTDATVDVGVRAYPFAFPVGSDGNLLNTAANRRFDVPTRFSIQLSSARLVFLSGSYTLLRNFSNSFGESYTRHRLRALVGARLPAQVTLSAQAAVQLTAYDDGVSVGQRLFLADDDESQNSLQFKLSRPLFGGMSVEGRVAWYGNELAREGVRFSRMTMAIGLRADL